MFASLILLTGGGLYETLTDIKPDVIIHCAGNTGIQSSVEYPAYDFTSSVTLSHNLMFSLHKLNLTHTRFIFLSSAGVYGSPKTLPISEDSPLSPLSPYALHKTMCEQMCMYFAANYGMDVKIARIFSAYGAGLKRQIFWDMFRKYRKTGRLDLFGTGQESRDYIHVDDVAQALYLLAVKDFGAIICNVANGQEITIRRAAELFADCAGLSRDNIHFNGVIREGDPLNWCADITRLNSLGYKKTVELEDGLRDYFTWASSLQQHSTKI